VRVGRFSVFLFGLVLSFYITHVIIVHSLFTGLKFPAMLGTLIALAWYTGHFEEYGIKKAREDMFVIWWGGTAGLIIFISTHGFWHPERDRALILGVALSLVFASKSTNGVLASSRYHDALKGWTVCCLTIWMLNWYADWKYGHLSEFFSDMFPLGLAWLAWYLLDKPGTHALIASNRRIPWPGLGLISGSILFLLEFDLKWTLTPGIKWSVAHIILVSVIWVALSMAKWTDGTSFPGSEE